MLFVLLGVLTLSGCVGFDPWDEFSRVPSSPSALYRREIEVDGPNSEAKPPRLPKELAGRKLTLADCIRLH